MFAISYNDSGFSPPNCSYSYPETLRLQVPRKEDYYVRDVAVQVGEYLFSSGDYSFARVLLHGTAHYDTRLNFYRNLTFTAYICPKLRSVAHRLATICDEFDQEFFLSSSEVNIYLLFKSLSHWAQCKGNVSSGYTTRIETKEPPRPNSARGDSQLVPDGGVFTYQY